MATQVLIMRITVTNHMPHGYRDHMPYGYRSKHLCGKNSGGIGKSGPASLPEPSLVSHAGLSPSAWHKKSPVPSISNGVLINHIELLHHIFPELTQIKIKSDNNMATFVNIVFDQKALSPGSCRYKNALYGIDPVIKANSLVDTYQDGYRVLLQYFINSFKAETITWVKQGEVFMVQLLDVIIAVPFAVFYLSKPSNSEEVETRVRTALLYLSVCTECLKTAKETESIPNCHYLSKICFINKHIYDAHLQLYDTWNCDLHPCEECMRNIVQGEATTCSRFRVMLSFSDQESAYEKFGHQILSIFEEYLAQDTSL